MGDGNGKTRTKLATRARPLVAIGVAGVFLGLIAWSVLDVQLGADESHRHRIEALEDTAHIVNLFHAGEQARIALEIARLRTELRAQALWANLGGAVAEGNAAGTARETQAVEGRQLEGLLRRNLAGSGSWNALELIVAGHDGLQVLGFENRVGRVLKRDWDEKQEGVAKALWYTDEVRRAIDSSGRRVERGDVSFERMARQENDQETSPNADSQLIERPIQRVAIGLHEPGELVQGVLVVTMDPVGYAGRLSELAREGQQINLVSLEGRPLDSAASPDQANRFAGIAARIFAAEVLPEVFEADGLLVLGRPLSGPEGVVSNLLALVETGSVSRGFPAWRATAWPGIVGVVAFLSVLSISLLYIQSPAPQAVATVAAAPNVEDPEIVIENARFSVREWLADVRGCLEREAATRGLSLDLRVEKTLPDEANGDVAWLGGLVVAMGREALDATAVDRVNLRVYEDAADVLRIEIDAGNVDLAPVAGMRVVARSMGGRIETAAGGRLALVVPSGMA